MTATCRDPGGAPATAATVTLTLGLPDGTTTTVPAIETVTGSYQADYVTVQPGRHTLRWVFTGPAHAYTDVLDVQPATTHAMFSLADGRKHLRLTSTNEDEELREWIDTTTRGVEWFVGPVAIRTVTELHNVRRADVLALRQVPAVEVSAIEAVLSGDSPYEVADTDLDPATGILRRLDGGLFHGPLRVVYTAGRRIVQDNITSAGKLILQHLWRTRQGPGRPQMGTSDYDVTEPVPGLGYAIPNRAMQLLSPDQLPPGMA
nr:hypothetical protein [Streptomyces sp. SID3212]